MSLRSSASVESPSLRLGDASWRRRRRAGDDGRVAPGNVQPSAVRSDGVSTISETYIENRERVQPDDVNNYGTVHGGNVAKWMDEVGAMSAMRHAGTTCVTARIDRLDFERPVPQGDTCVIESYAYATGRTSIRVRLRAFREEPRTGERERTTESYFVFVAVDDDMRPTDVADIEVGSERCRELREAALAGEEG
jgi:acyl-CoA hydrolase